MVTGIITNMNICNKSETLFSTLVIIDAVVDTLQLPFLGQWTGFPASLSVGCNQLTLLLGTVPGL